MLNRSCMDCHSNRTVWPWYSFVAPMSWLVERDVHEGRTHMNLSEWDQYTFEKRQKLLADIASVVKNGEMPLQQYTLIHRNAKLSEADTDVLYTWARVQRRRMKAALKVVPTKGSKADGTADGGAGSPGLEYEKRFWRREYLRARFGTAQ